MIEKRLKDMTYKQQIQAYNQAIESGEVEDIFEGFCYMHKRSIYRIYDDNSLEMIECSWF